MSKYNCINCNFKSTNKKDYNRHILTKKHLEKCNIDDGVITSQHGLSTNSSRIADKNKFECELCHSKFARLCNLSRHKTICDKTRVENIIKDTEVNSLKEKVQILENQLNKFEKQVETYETMLKSLTTPQTINYFNFICANYQDSPALEGKLSYANMIEAKTLKLIDVISMYFYDNKLVSFLGDYIIRLYKKEEPKNQSMWSTDISRLTYIIRESCKVNGNTWSYDKKGIKTKKIVIEPALNFIRESLVKFCQDNGGKTEANILKQMIAANGTIQLIDDGDLATDIVRYIASEFAVTQADSQAIIKV